MPGCWWISTFTVSRLTPSDLTTSLSPSPNHVRSPEGKPRLQRRGGITQYLARSSDRFLRAARRTNPQHGRCRKYRESGGGGQTDVRNAEAALRSSPGWSAEMTEATAGDAGPGIGRSEFPRADGAERAQTDLPPCERCTHCRVETGSDGSQFLTRRCGEGRYLETGAAHRPGGRPVLDVWEHEPAINPELHCLEKFEAPHNAGDSTAGKANRISGRLPAFSAGRNSRVM